MTTKRLVLSKIGVDMKKQTETLLSEAIDLVDAADHLLANTMSQYDLSAKDCYDLAEKLECARNLLLVVGDRKYQTELNKIPLPEGVPF
jgi:hypothetical protein